MLTFQNNLFIKGIKVTPAAFFQDICGLGKPSALQSTLASDPWANCLSVGSTVQRGGTEGLTVIFAVNTLYTLMCSLFTKTEEGAGGGEWKFSQYWIIKNYEVIDSLPLTLILKNQKFTQSDCKDIWIRNFEFVTKTQFLYPVIY